MSKRKENIELQRKQAEAKKLAIQANTETLEAKVKSIQEQILANKEKMKKIDYFLQKLGTDNSRSSEV